MTPDDELRALLQKIAATAGDPPEHGLAGVAARRRRRTRYRRGAVATAVALAVLAVSTNPRVGWFGGDDHDVTATETAAGHRRSDLPDVVVLRCSPAGIELPVASVQTQSDGMHLDVENGFVDPIDVWVHGDTWDSGRVVAPPGRSTIHQAVPPGSITVGCQVNGQDEQRSVHLVDVRRFYDTLELACEERDVVVSTERWATLVPSPRLAIVARGALTGHGLRNDDHVEPFSGYPSADYEDPTTDPAVQIRREGEILAFAHLAAEGAADPSDWPPTWEAVVRLEACADFFLPDPDTDDTPAGTTETSGDNPGVTPSLP